MYAGHGCLRGIEGRLTGATMKAASRFSGAKRCGLVLPCLVVARLLVCVTLGSAAFSPGVLAQDELPQFRQVSKSDVSGSLRKVRNIRFAMNEQFPPFAFRDSTGALTGFLPLLADALCADLRVSCEFVTRDTDAVQLALTNKQADAAVFLTRPEELDFSKLDFTRPFLRPFGRFAGRSAGPIRQADVRTLAGKRIGVRQGTSHGRFIQQYYPRSLLVPYATQTELYEAARTGSVDIMFDDAFRLMFWMQGTGSGNCCDFIGRGFLDKASFSQPLVFAVRREDGDLRKVLDYGLDRLQTSGRFAQLYNRFFPRSPF